MPSIPIMPFVILALFLLPFKFAPQQLKTLAFAIWLAGGVVLVMLGVTRLMYAPETAPMVMGLSCLAAVVIGFAKGKFVLSKTARKNVARINQMVQPQKAINVYSLPSWLMISLMVLISIALNVGQVPDMVRGAVNLGIGLALIVSSFVYTGPASRQLPHSL
jgi:hypothetical protein